ncbi:2OG-FeII_Oxy domain-containing protein/DIOX_N domain-containing protein [Cephalotus follicularis]|uniref:gibberellin 3beta-dioxygenase n=1 Tax=Cephalotus follicularis TaxID=3775 RepID=A0A1Q3DGJ5_CEPFO|nr:2OG-FeII_Oxy domain-containing protein/DIOX_N domain-containing protein [Cephalotus follicularis]GAV91423.1 2OG-FeII_Oxy domain-containing protein/DIOX_N domain-containing protein [Cephalotus follicularis]
MPSSLSDALIDHPVDLQHKHQDFALFQEVPDSYTWIQRDDYPSGDSVISESVPVIDLNDPNALQLIGHACKTWGVFQVINHSFPMKLLDNIECVSRSLFSLPLQQKLKAARSPHGVTGYGFARIASHFSKLFWSEGFTVLGSPLEHFCKLWPQDYTKYSDVIEDYVKEMKALAGSLLWLMLGSLGISKEDIKWAGPKGDFEEDRGALQLNYYPVCPDPERAMGLAAHTDSTLLTILYQTSTSGLQVLKDGVGWVTVPPVDGALVVNVGDLLHMLSNGLYPSMLHRAMVNRNQDRISVGYFHGPPNGVQISPIPKLVGPCQRPLYRAVTWSEYISTKAKHFDKALLYVSTCAPINERSD